MMATITIEAISGTSAIARIMLGTQAVVAQFAFPDD